MSTSRRLPKFDSAHFESLSHEEKLVLLNHFLDALDRSQNARTDQPEELSVQAPRHARTSG